jgi:enamine deaminase RidA (YjgF/YER057c/UK114 family)
MPKQHVNPPSLFPSLEHGFSQAVVASGARIVFISGQTAWDVNKRIVGKSMSEQARSALRNVRAAVEAAGGHLSDIVALRIYFVAVAAEIDGIGTALRDVFATVPPASTWIGVARLARPEFLIEIEATAVLE